MKKLIIIALSLCVFASCKKSSETPTPNNPSTGPRSFTCNLGATAYVADSAWYNISNGGFNIFASKGIGATWQYFEINLNAQTASTYAIPANAFTYLTSTTTYVGASGSLTVTSYDAVNRKISGTFTSVGAGALTISGGTFTSLPFK